ncbi:MAG: catalase [Alphaproteobacteria bacterium]|nr:catalase [Alphaproteobacteria bacterium]
MPEDRTTKSLLGAKLGSGGEIHQQSGPRTPGGPLTTNQGVPVGDNQNSLRIGSRGPTALEDFILREKITHFDHERIPERIVHARGSAAHGHFQVYESLSRLTRAAFLQKPSEKTPVFVRFSTVAGGAGSADTVRDVRGFAVKFYTSEGNFDLVGNNIPIFFIQDAVKFPDLIHAVKMEPDRGFPQAASAHDTFWDFASLMPESMHMLMWAMSDRAIPRSFRMMQGFGIHTFRLVNAKGESTFVKFHWRPVAGAASLLWDEAVKLAGADCDFHRRDLWDAIANGDFPEFELGIQAFDQATADGLGFDVLDPTKLIPEETVPVKMIGKMVLDRNPENFFAETEQVAFHPGHVVPGIDFSNDPLLQGRLHSYLDTQLSRLGGPNFHELPVNQPRCPMRNFQRDGLMRMARPSGRVAYEPNSLDPGGPREDPKRGFVSYPESIVGDKLRTRSPSFADHYTQARMFWQSMTDPEQRHIVAAFAFELGKVETAAIRQRMLGHLKHIHPQLLAGVADALGMAGQEAAIEPVVAPNSVAPSPALSLVRLAQPTLKGRVIGVLLTDGVDAGLIADLRETASANGARIAVVSPRIGGAADSDGHAIKVDHALASGPSVLFDAVVVAPSSAAATMLAGNVAAIDWVRDAFRHLKAIGYASGSEPLLVAAGIDLSADAGVVPLGGKRGDLKAFVAAAKQQRIWSREERSAEAD